MLETFRCQLKRRARQMKFLVGSTSNVSSLGSCLGTSLAHDTENTMSDGTVPEIVHADR